MYRYTQKIIDFCPLCVRFELLAPSKFAIVAGKERCCMFLNNILTSNEYTTRHQYLILVDQI